MPVWAWSFAYVLLLAFLVPPFLRMPLDCDPQLFDLFVRDARQGALLYRDMVENKTPIMFGIHHAVRSTLGWSSEAMRAVDLIIVGGGILGLVKWIPSTQNTLRWLLLMALTAFYLTLSEWCHVQCDVWLLAPIISALHLRRNHPYGSMGARLLEGLLWGVAVVLKPHAIVVVFAVWLVGNWRSRRDNGATIGDMLADTFSLALGAASVGIATLLIMDRLDLWQPYLLHLKACVGDYAKADFCGPYGATRFRVQFAMRMLPWTLVYIFAVLDSTIRLLRMMAGQRRNDDGLLSAALLGWTVQAFAFQHVFDYPHVAPIMISVAILFRRLDARGWLVPGVVALTAAFLVAKGPYLAERAELWTDCFKPQLTPAFRDRLKQLDFVSWEEMAPVAIDAVQHRYVDGDVLVVSDSALPFWQLTALRPPTRYYLFRNNVLAFRSQRQQIIDTVAALPHLKVIVCDLNKLRWQSTPSTAPHDLPDDWYGSAHWADRVIFRSGRYAVVAMEAHEFPRWVSDVTDWEK